MKDFVDQPPDFFLPRAYRSLRRQLELLDGSLLNLRCKLKMSTMQQLMYEKRSFSFCGLQTC
jgi:hypothetical protein